MTERKQTKNSVIDALLKEGVTDNQVIVAKVLEQFPEASEAAVKRQTYSRRNALKSKSEPAAQ